MTKLNIEKIEHNLLSNIILGGVTNKYNARTKDDIFLVYEYRVNYTCDAILSTMREVLQLMYFAKYKSDEKWYDSFKLELISIFSNLHSKAIEGKYIELIDAEIINKLVDKFVTRIEEAYTKQSCRYCCFFKTLQCLEKQTKSSLVTVNSRPCESFVIIVPLDSDDSEIENLINRNKEKLRTKNSTLH